MESINIMARHSDWNAPKKRFLKIPIRKYPRNYFSSRVPPLSKEAIVDHFSDRLSAPSSRSFSIEIITNDLSWEIILAPIEPTGPKGNHESYAFFEYTSNRHSPAYHSIIHRARCENSKPDNETSRNTSFDSFTMHS